MIKKLDNLVLGRHNTFVTKYLTNLQQKDYQMKVTEEELRDMVITRNEAKNIAKEHGVEPEEMYADLGLKSLYQADQLLDWLGY